MYPKIVDSTNRIVRFYVDLFTELPFDFKKFQTERVYSSKSNLVANLTQYFSNPTANHTLIHLHDVDTIHGGTFNAQFPNNFENQENIYFYRVSHDINILNKVITKPKNLFTDVLYRNVAHATKLIASLFPTISSLVLSK